MKTLRILVLLTLAATCPATFAADQAGRLTLDIKIDGIGQTRGVEGRSTFKTAQGAHLAVTLHGTGEPEPINRLDDASFQNMNAAQGAALQARMPSEAEQERIAAEAEKALAACKNDIACMRRVSEKVSRQTAAWTAPASIPTPASAHYLSFSGVQPSRCNPEYRVRVQDSVEGTKDDVHALIPYSEQTSADHKGSARDTMAVCASMAVLDTKTGNLWVLAELPAPSGTITHTERKERKTYSPSEGVQLDKQAIDWVLDQLKGKVPRAGTRKTTLRLPLTGPGQKGENVVNVEMTWKFDAR